MDVQLPHYHLLKDWFFPSSYLSTFVENYFFTITNKKVSLFLSSQLFPVDHQHVGPYAGISLLMIVALWLSFKFRRISLQTLYFFFKILFASLKSSDFHVNVRIQHISFHTKSALRF